MVGTYFGMNGKRRSQWRNRRGTGGQSASPDVFHWEVLLTYREKRDKEKRENGEEKKENGESEGGKLKMEVE